MAFEEHLSDLKLLSENEILHIAIQSWGGLDQINLQQSRNKQLLPTIITDINEFYLNNKVAPNFIAAILCISTGIFALIFAMVFISVGWFI